MANPNIWAPGTSVDANSSIATQAFIATEGQTDFTITNFTYTVGTGSLLVFVGSGIQRIITDWIEVSSTEFSLVVGPPEGTVVYVVGFTEIATAVPIPITDPSVYPKINATADGWDFLTADEVEADLLDDGFDSGGPSTITANSASAALTITQEGAGNVLVVEDAANPDSTPFVIDANGNVLVGYTARFDISTTGTNQYAGISSATPSASDWKFAALSFSADTAAQAFAFVKSRSATVGTNTIVQSGDRLGTLTFKGADGTNYVNSVVLAAEVDGTPGTADMPGRFIVQVSPDGSGTPAEGMRIAADKTVTLGGTSTAPALSIIPTASQVNWVKVQAAATGVGATITTDGESTVPLLHNTKGGAYHSFLTNGFEHVRVTHTASANRYITLTGSNGGNSTIGVSAGNLAITPTIVLAGSLSQTTANSGEFTLFQSTSASTENAVRIDSTQTTAGAGLKLSNSGLNTQVSIRLGGSGSFSFYTGQTAGQTTTGGASQVVITDTASATRYITLTGSNGGNPAIGASAGTVALTSGAISTSASNGLGYGTGAGGTVTQATNKSTAVTLNKPCGQITMNNAALAAGTSVTFQLNNSILAITDILVANHSGSGGTTNAYAVDVLTVSTGLAYIRVTNITGGSLSEALVINFSVLKSVTS